MVSMMLCYLYAYESRPRMPLMVKELTSMIREPRCSILSIRIPTNSVRVNVFLDKSASFLILIFFSAPAKKGKKSKQLKGIPMELQVQWEKDRQTKAEKKRQREVARHLEEFESSIVSGSSRNGKKKRYAKKGGKDSKQIYRASVAHLIPGSAADVADMFSEEEGLSDSENEEYFRPSDRDEMIGIDSFSLSLKPKNARFSMGFKKNKKRSLEKKVAVGPEWKTLDWVDDLIQAFLKDKKSESISLPPMDKEGRKKIHMLAECYGVGSTSRGSGKKKSM